MKYSLGILLILAVWISLYLAATLKLNTLHIRCPRCGRWWNSEGEVAEDPPAQWVQGTTDCRDCVHMGKMIDAAKQ